MLYCHDFYGLSQIYLSLYSIYDRKQKITQFLFPQGDKSSYIENELESLEREQEAIDEKASDLEKKLRAVMGGNSSNKTNNNNNDSSFFSFLRSRNSFCSRPGITIQDLLNTSDCDSDSDSCDNNFLRVNRGRPKRSHSFSGSRNGGG